VQHVVRRGPNTIAVVALKRNRRFAEASGVDAFGERFRVTPCNDRRFTNLTHHRLPAVLRFSETQNT
jgi:hypothetical protein